MTQIAGQLSLFDYLAEITIPVTKAFDPLREVALRGSGFEGGKSRIESFFRGNVSSRDRTSFLKKEYGIGGFCQGWSDKSRYQIHSFDTIGFGKNSGKVTIRWFVPGKDGDEEKAYSYAELADMIDTLIKEGVYNG